MDRELIKRQKELAEAYMKVNDPNGDLSYHNWGHVTRVIEATERLLEKADIQGIEKEDLLLAAIWHDADFAKGADDHEKRSAQIAFESLAKEGIPEERLENVVRLIEATNMDQDPTQHDEQLIRDADLGHLSCDDYVQFYKGLYEEVKVTKDYDGDDAQWRKDCIGFMSDIEYFSPEGKELFEAGKEANLTKLKELDEKLDSREGSSELTEAERKTLKKRRKKRRNRNKPNFNPEKGIETMFRVSLRNHINLSRIADDKANTLISVNAIILSIVLSALFPKMDSNPWLIYPGMALILVSISTIILATLSTIPKTTHGAVSLDDVKNKRGNLLFFGNFHKMTVTDFEFGMKELMKDGEYLYGSMTRDLYYLGIVLNRKYELLRRAYLIFVVGLVISILLFAWSILSLPPESISEFDGSDIL